MEDLPGSDSLGSLADYLRSGFTALEEDPAAYTFNLAGERLYGLMQLRLADRARLRLTRLFGTADPLAGLTNSPDTLTRFDVKLEVQQ